MDVEKIAKTLTEIAKACTNNCNNCAIKNFCYSDVGFVEAPSEWSSYLGEMGLWKD